MRGTIGLLVVALVGCSDSAVAIPSTCNGSEALCDRSFDGVAYVTTHNAMSSEEDGWILPNQYLNIASQLRDGVRALMLDVHPWEGEPYLCHGACLLGSERLVDGLRGIREFLGSARGEVISFILETYVPAEEFAAAMEESGLLEYVYVHDGGPWPTLREMIDADERLVVLSDEDDGTFAWYHYVWDLAWETPFAARETTDFTCDRNRGSEGNDLFIFNHFLTRTRPVPEDADVVNAVPFLSDRLDECMAESGSLPSFVTVDFYSVGDVFEAVDRLNGL